MLVVTTWNGETIKGIRYVMAVIAFSNRVLIPLGSIRESHKAQGFHWIAL